MLLIDLVQLGHLSLSLSRILNIWILASKELLEDLEMVTFVDIARELVSSFLHAMLQTVLAILVVDPFHQRVRQHFISFAQFDELFVLLSFTLDWTSQGMMLKGQLAEGICDLLAIGRWLDLERAVVPRLVAVHRCSTIKAVSITNY